MQAHRSSYVLSFLLIAFAAPCVAEPSFDCSKAEAGSTEALICGDPELSEMDREVDRLYRKVNEQTSAEDFKTIEAYQRGWLKGRNESWKTSDPRQFVFDTYQDRIAVLSVQAGEVEVPDPISFDCAGGEFDRLTTTFYETMPPVGVFTRTPGGDWPQYIATGWADEGAIHYNTGGLDFIERDEKADLNWAGTLMDCTRVESISGSE